MELRQLRYFVALAEELHFGRAAARVHIVQPALSQQIRALEQELGVRLIERTTRRVALTSAGSVFLDEARQLLADADRARLAARRAERGEIGRLAIGFVSAASLRVLPAMLGAFRAAHANVQISLFELGTFEQMRALAERRIDVGLVLAPADVRGLSTRVVDRDSLVAVLPVRHRLARRSEVALADLADEDIVWMNRSSERQVYDYYVRECEAAGFYPRIAHEVAHVQSMLTLVAAGLGVSHAPAAIRRVRVAGVRYVSLVRPTIACSIDLAWNPANPSPTLANFLSMSSSARAR